MTFQEQEQEKTWSSEIQRAALRLRSAWIGLRQSVECLEDAKVRQKLLSHLRSEICWDSLFQLNQWYQKTKVLQRIIETELEDTSKKDTLLEWVFDLQDAMTEILSSAEND